MRYLFAVSAAKKADSIKMKTISLTLLLICLFQFAKAQISGKVTAVDGKPLPYVTVAVIKATDSSSVKSMLTDELGLYQLKSITPGSYRIRLSSIGHQTWFSPVFKIAASDPAKDFGVRIMVESTRQLGEVVIRSNKPMYQQRSDGIVVNVESSILTKGSSALQVLERSPGVTIDHRNSGIALNGKSGATIMINGKQVRMPLEQVTSLLNGTSADNIEKIELLSTPPAGYDAEGSAGIINIVMKKSKKQGTNGSYSLTGGYGMGEKGTANFNLNHSTKNINLYGSYTYLHDRTYTDLFIDGHQIMPFLGGATEVAFYTKTKQISNNHNATIGADIKLDSLTTLSSSLTYNNSHSPGYTYSHAGYNVLPDSLLVYDGHISNRNSWNNLISSISIEKILSTGEKISFDADYIHYSNNSPSDVQSSFINKHNQQVYANNSVDAEQQKGFANTAINVAVAKIDYSKPLSTKLRLETGIKGAYTGSTSSSGIESFLSGAWVRNHEVANEIFMKEGIGAAYISFNARFSNTINLVAGTRYEYSYTNMDNPQTHENLVNRKLSVLFPTLLFTIKTSEKAEIQLSYTKRISRPTYDDLASYVGYSDPTAVYTGNPFLKPTITNTIKLGYNYGDYAFSLLFSHDSNPISRYQLSDSPQHDLLFISPQNLVYQNNLTFQTNLPFKVSSWWDMNYNFVGGLRRFKETFTRYPFTKSYFGYSVNFNELFKLSKSFSAEVSGVYNSYSINGTQTINGFGVLNAGIKKELNNNKGTIQLSVADILSSSRIHVYYGTLTPEPFDIYSHVAINTESRHFPIIKLTYSRSFGGTGSSNRSRRQNGSNDEADRIRKN